MDIKRSAVPASLEWTGDVGKAPTLKYHVQVSKNDGFNWDTVAVNQTGKSIDLDAIRKEHPGSPFKVKVITTDGFDVKEHVLDVATRD